MQPLIKGTVNPAFKAGASGGRYADLADLVNAVREPLGLNGLAFFHTMIDGTSMQTSLVHGESETRIDCTVPLIVARNDMQGMKSATTYAKRIGLESVTGIAPEDDDGNAAVDAAPKADAKPGKPDPNSEHANANAPADIAGLNDAVNTEDLSRAWFALPAWARADRAFIDAKDKRKAELGRKAEARKAELARVRNEDLGGDAIPYEGK